MPQEEIANIFIQTMQAHADARPYDWVMFYVGIFGIIASLLVAYFAYRLNKKQIAIAERQSKISEEQTEIANKQTEIMELQNRIALFDKKYELFRELEQLHINLLTILHDEHFLRLTSLLTPKECAEYFIKAVFYKIISFAPSLINDELSFPSTSQKCSSIIKTLIKFEKAEFIFLLSEAELNDYQNVLNGLSTILHRITGLSNNSIRIKKEIIYTISSEDLAPLTKLSYLINIFRKQLKLS